MTFNRTYKSPKKCTVIFSVLKEYNCQPGILYPGKIPFKNEGKIKSCLKQKQKNKKPERLTMKEILPSTF